MPGADRHCFLPVIFVALLCGAAEAAPALTNSLPGAEYQIYAGNTHSHTMFTWSHGEQWENSKLAEGEAAAKLRVTPEGVQSPPEGKVLRADWHTVQGPPSAHFALAKANGYDFYVTTDHSQEKELNPVSPTNTAWLATKRQAAEATDEHFVALAGYEHSENNGPGGVGHLNVINSAEYLNALAPGIDLKYLYRWLKTVPANGDGPVVASFNHPGIHQYNDWDYRDPEVTDIITMLEVINSNRAGHYPAFVAALDKGWKVSPVCGNDNHGFYGITHHSARTFLLATNLTKAALLDAMKHRRTYAALDKSIQCRYTVNGQVMGSTLDRPTRFQFDIAVSDPATGNPGHRITKIDIVQDSGVITRTFNPEPDFSIRWSPVVDNATNKYFFVRVWNASGGDTKEANPAKPMAWLAPVWTGR